MKSGVATPLWQFWMNQPTAWHWAQRTMLDGKERGIRLQNGKGMGMIFRVDVTGIKSRDRFLKGPLPLTFE
jgi:hypothetical protein